VTRVYEYESDFVRRFVLQGRAEGATLSLLMVLKAREIDVPDDALAQVTACDDLAQLEAWIRRAATATSSDDVFT
jgi:hypothetical protein